MSLSEDLKSISFNNITLNSISKENVVAKFRIQIALAVIEIELTLPPQWSQYPILRVHIAFADVSEFALQHALLQGREIIQK